MLTLGKYAPQSPFAPLLMRFGTSQITAVLEEYLRELVSLLPQSAAGRLEDPPSGWTSGDDRMVRLLSLGRMGEMLRHCTDRQARILIRSVGGRAFTPRTQRVGFVQVPTEGKSRSLTSAELAKLEGLTLRQYRREMESARTAVSHAISDSIERKRRAA